MDTCTGARFRKAKLTGLLLESGTWYLFCFSGNCLVWWLIRPTHMTGGGRLLGRRHAPVGGYCIRLDPAPYVTCRPKPPHSIRPRHADLAPHTRPGGAVTHQTTPHRRELVCKLFALDPLRPPCPSRRSPVACRALSDDIVQLWTGKTSGALRTRHAEGLNRYAGTVAHSNWLGVRMLRAVDRPLANRRRLSWRTNLQCNWCRRVSSAPNAPSIRGLHLCPLLLTIMAAFPLFGLLRLAVPFLCLMLGDMSIWNISSQLLLEPYLLPALNVRPDTSNPWRLISTSMSRNTTMS